MTTHTQTAQAVSNPLVATILAAVLGLGIIMVTGHVQAGALHAAAHDVRHATGFPCH